MKDKRFIEALDRLNIRDSRREELLGEILLRAEAEEREQKYMKKSRRSGRRGASPWRALAPIFAVVLIIGAVLLVPSVGEAVSGWFGRLFDRNKYLGTLPENRASMPDVDRRYRFRRITSRIIPYTLLTKRMKPRNSPRRGQTSALTRMTQRTGNGSRRQSPR